MRWLALPTVIAILGCGPSAGGDDGGDGDGDGTSGAATTADDSAGAESASAESESAESASATESSATTIDTGVDDDADDDDADDGPKLDIAVGCDFETIVCDDAEGSKVPPVDCGFVTLADDLEAWRTAHQCASEALADETAVKVLWEEQGTDSILYGALVGFVGESYAISEYGYDSWGEPLVWSRVCENGVSSDDCTVAVGEMCLGCAGVGLSTSVCG